MNEQLLLPSGMDKSVEVNMPQPKEKKEVSPVFMTGIDILNNKDIHEKFLLDPILPCGTVCFLAGPSDTGKSLLSRQIATAVALGKSSVIGMPLKLKHNKAIVISTEDDKTNWQEKLKMYGLSSKEKGLEHLLVSFEPETCSIDRLRYCLLANPVDLIVIDVFADIFQGNLNDVMDVRNFLKPYKKLASDFGCTILFLHHLTKAGQKSEPSKISLVGSQGLEAIARSVIDLRADASDDEVRLLSILKMNYIPPALKKQAYRLKLNKKLEFENDGITGKRGNSVENKELIGMIHEKKKKGLSTRNIAKEITEDGISLGKSTVSKVLKENPLPVSDTTEK